VVSNGGIVLVDVKGNRQTKQKKLLYEFREIESLFAFDVVSDYRICRMEVV